MITDNWHFKKLRTVQTFFLEYWENDFEKGSDWQDVFSWMLRKWFWKGEWLAGCIFLNAEIMILKRGVTGRMYFRQITFYYENASGGWFTISISSRSSSVSVKPNWELNLGSTSSILVTCWPDPATGWTEGTTGADRSLPGGNCLNNKYKHVAREYDEMIHISW